jgi:uncharacterized phage-associated protein
MDIKKEKLKNAILFFAKGMYLTKTKLMKALYELDFRHFKETGKSVTGLDYSAWDRGPVPPKVFFKFQKDNSLSPDFDEIIRISPQNKGIRILNKVAPNMKYFTKREKRIIDDVLYIYKNADTGMMVGASHEVNKPWDITYRTKGKGKRIDYLLVIDEKSPITKQEAIQKQEEAEETKAFFDAICS